MDRTARLMLISSSYVYGDERYLGYCTEELRCFLPSGSRVLFVPFGYSMHAQYTQLVRDAFGKLGAVVTGAHDANLRDVSSIVDSYEAIFCGGGNTFLLLAELYKRNLLALIRDAVTQGVRYMGTSAGTNVACPTICTTNDMPIVEPKSLNALGLVPFHVNPHYYERPQGLEHMGETRRDRILEFFDHNDAKVLALREGAILLVENGIARIVGRNGGIAFHRGAPAQPVRETDLMPGDVATFLLE